MFLICTVYIAVAVSMAYMYYTWHIVHVQMKNNTEELHPLTKWSVSCRFSSTMPRIKSLITKYGDNLDMELQQRAVEYTAIFSKHDEMRLVLVLFPPLPLPGFCPHGWEVVGPNHHSSYSTTPTVNNNTKSLPLTLPLMKLNCHFAKPNHHSNGPGQIPALLLSCEDYQHTWVHTHIHGHTHKHSFRAGLLERMPVMTTKATSTDEGSLLQNGEPAATSAETTSQLPLQVCLDTVL